MEKKISAEETATRKELRDSATFIRHHLKRIRGALTVNANCIREGWEIDQERIGQHVEMLQQASANYKDKVFKLKAIQDKG